MNWFAQKGYKQGVFFSLLFLAIGPFLDAITKLLGENLPPVEILFFRFLFSSIIIAPTIIKGKLPIFRLKSQQNDTKLNILRGFLGFFSFLGCIYSVKFFPLSEITVIFWTMPFFVLILSAIILKEKVTKPRYLATIIGFCGLCFFFSPTFSTVNLCILLPIITTFFFAAQDIIIKKITTPNPMVFIFEYSAIIILCALPFAIFAWVQPSFSQIFLLFLLGVGANLMQFFIFKAFDATDISSLAPLRYTEFIFASIFGYIFFAEIPSVNTFFAGVIIIPTTLFLVFSENKNKKT